MSTSSESYLNSEQEEISLVDILDFVKASYRWVLGFTALGIGFALIYLLMTPAQYEASVQIAMAQVSAANNNNNNNNLSPLGINIEEPALLIARMSSPASFNEVTVNACGLRAQPNPGQILASSIKLTPVKNVSNVVELKAIGLSPQEAKACASAVFELIKTTQAQLIAPYIQEAQTKFAQDQKRLLSAQQVVANADKSGQAMSASFLATRDEIRYLLDRMAALQDLIAGSQARETRLIAPIYVSDHPVAPKKRPILFGGLLSGLLLGALVAFVRQKVDKLKTQAKGLL